MFLTRLGSGSKAVITGDLTQIDLPNPKKSGLWEALHVLDGVEGIRFCRFEDVDVVRHALVQRIVRAYDSHTRAEQVPMGMEGEGELGWSAACRARGQAIRGEAAVAALR